MSSNGMAAAADEMQFLGMLLRLINAKRTLEIGEFTGYSLLATPLALPEDGTALAIDVDRKNYELGRPVIEKAGVPRKIDFREGKALAILDELLNEFEGEKEEEEHARLIRAMERSSNDVHDDAEDKQVLTKQDNKSLLRSEALYKYILETSVYPREPEALRELRLITAEHPRNVIAASADEVQFLGMLLRLINAKRTLEIGVFTGYSLLATALAIPEDGTILAIDVDRKSYELGLPVIEKAGVAHKIDFREGKALAILDELVNMEKYKGWFDFVFVDADKGNYLNYHERVLELVRVGGVIGYDNTLWGGSVAAAPDELLPWHLRGCRDYVVELNKVLAADRRIEICHLSISDGLTLCRRLY